MVFYGVVRTPYDWKGLTLKLGSELNILSLFLTFLKMPVYHGILFQKQVEGRGEHSQWKVVWGYAAVMTPFFQASRRSLAYQFTINTTLMCPPFSIFRKILHFQPFFGQNFSSQDANFPNFCSQEPSFFKENLLPIPYFWKPMWCTHTKKKLRYPPGLKVTPLTSFVVIMFQGEGVLGFYK